MKTSTHTFTRLFCLAIVLSFGATIAVAQKKGDAETLSEARNALLQWNAGKARAALNRLTEKQSTDANVVRAQANALEGKYEAAASQLEAVVNKSATANALIALGEVRLLQDRKGPADQAFTRAARLAEQRTKADARDANSWFELGVARQRLRQYPQAIEALKRSRTLQPGRAETHYQLGRTLAFAENWEAAMNNLNAALERDSGIAYAYYYRGLTANRLGQKEKTVNDLERFVTLAPNAPDAERARRIVQAAGR